MYNDISMMLDELRNLERIRGEEKSRSEEHTSELQSHVRISYAVFCLKKKKNIKTQQLKMSTTLTNKTLLLVTV